MEKKIVWNSEYFCGNKISEYGLQNGYVDYSTLAKSFDAVLNNNIIGVTGWENWNQENGYIDNSDELEELEEKIEELEEELEDIRDTDFEEEEIKLDRIEELEEKIVILNDRKAELEEEQENDPEIFQYYIISDEGARILEEYTDEIVFYNDSLDMYVWGVTHYGTSWSYVLTDIKIELDK